MSLLETWPTSNIKAHQLLLERLTPKQQSNIKSLIIDINNRFNEIIPFFSSFNHEFSLGNRLIDIFPNCFYFYFTNRKSKYNVKNHLCNLDNITLQVSTDLHMAVVILDASIKNQVTISIAHIHVHNSPIIKMIHQAVNVIFTKTELFAIRCGINQEIHLLNINQIVIVMDSIHAAKRIFNSSSHPYQIHLVSILYKLRKFFKWNSSNSIEFWDCSSYYEWSLHSMVNKEMKKFDLTPIFLCKSS